MDDYIPKPLRFEYTFADMITMLRFILFIVLFSACQQNRSTRLTIATAANVHFAMQELASAFSNETGIQCDLIVGSSGKLTAQINEGAPYHLFVSADMKYPEELYRAGKSVHPPKVYGLGKLVLWTKRGAPNINAFTSDNVRHIAIANPKTAPYGEAALEVLNSVGLLDSVRAKLVYGESIAQVNQFVESGTADFGFTAKSVVLSPKMRGNGQWAEVADSLYTPIQQGVVVLENGEKEKAQQFYDFLFSENGKAILMKYGYGVDF